MQCWGFDSTHSCVSVAWYNNDECSSCNRTANWLFCCTHCVTGGYCTIFLMYFFLLFFSFLCLIPYSEFWKLISVVIKLVKTLAWIFAGLDKRHAKCVGFEVPRRWLWRALTSGIMLFRQSNLPPARMRKGNVRVELYPHPSLHGAKYWKLMLPWHGVCVCVMYGESWPHDAVKGRLVPGLEQWNRNNYT